MWYGFIYSSIYIYIHALVVNNVYNFSDLVVDCGIVVSEFELQSLHYIHFRTNTLGKGMNPLILPAMG